MKFILYNYVSAKVVFSIEENDVHYKKKNAILLGFLTSADFFAGVFKTCG
jgi:hypothetical protein